MLNQIFYRQVLVDIMYIENYRILIIPRIFNKKCGCVRVNMNLITFERKVPNDTHKYISAVNISHQELDNVSISILKNVCLNVDLLFHCKSSSNRDLKKFIAENGHFFSRYILELVMISFFCFAKSLRTTKGL